jgi:hypothetical protein
MMSDIILDVEALEKNMSFLSDIEEKMSLPWIFQKNQGTFF